MKRFITAIILMLAFCSFPRTAAAQYRDGLDSIAFKATDLIAPFAIMTTALSIHTFAHDSWDTAVRDGAQAWRQSGIEKRGRDIAPFDDYIQYAPLVLDLGLGFTGVRTRHCFVDRTIEAALAYASLGIISGSAKEIFYTLRPNGADYKSFPSGHTSFVFTGAELVRLEYGWGWGAGAYAVATTVAVMRVCRDWHWMSDVMMGAGVGILCANIGNWLLEPTKRLFGINLPEKWRFGMAPSYDPVSGSVGAQFALRF